MKRGYVIAIAVIIILLLINIFLVFNFQEAKNDINPANNAVENKPNNLNFDTEFAQLKTQLGLALKSGGMTSESYVEIENKINQFENNGVSAEKIDELRKILSSISVGGSNSINKTISEVQSKNENRISYEILTEKEKALLPDCKTELFKRAPVDFEKIVGIEPIGSTNPPEHTLASSSTDTYIFVDTRETEKTVPLYAPGDIWIISITPRYNVTSDPEDHVIQYALCKDVYGVIDHIKEFSPQIKEIIKNYKCPYGGIPGDQKCPLLLLEFVKAGTHLGAVGRMQGNFNFGVWDLRHNNSFVNPTKYGIRSLHSICPFNYYPEPLKTQLINLLDRKDKNCGTVEYDILGTAQGEWFYGDAGNKMHGDWFNHLFFGYSNRFPEAAVISAGGIISTPLKWMFIPQENGNKNLKFANVKDTNAIYCYENNGNGEYRNYEKGPSGRILIQLVDFNTLKIEHQTGICSEPYSFIKPVIYKK